MVVLEVKDYLTSEDIEKLGNEVTFLNEGVVVPADQSQFGRARFEIGVKVSDGAEKVWGINYTTQKAIVSLLGQETKDWIGRLVKLKIVEENVMGTMRKVFYLADQA